MIRRAIRDLTSVQDFREEIGEDGINQIIFLGEVLEPEVRRICEIIEKKEREKPPILIEPISKNEQIFVNSVIQKLNKSTNFFELSPKTVIKDLIDKENKNSLIYCYEKGENIILNIENFNSKESEKVLDLITKLITNQQIYLSEFDSNNNNVVKKNKNFSVVVIQKNSFKKLSPPYSNIYCRFCDLFRQFRFVTFETLSNWITSLETTNQQEQLLNLLKNKKSHLQEETLKYNFKKKQEEEEKLKAIQIKKQEEEKLKAIQIKKQEEEKLKAIQIKKQEEEKLKAIQIKKQEEEKLKAIQIKKQEEEKLKSIQIKKQEEEKLKSRIGKIFKNEEIGFGDKNFSEKKEENSEEPSNLYKIFPTFRLYFDISKNESIEFLKDGGLDNLKNEISKIIPNEDFQITNLRIGSIDVELTYKAEEVKDYLRKIANGEDTKYFEEKFKNLTQKFSKKSFHILNNKDLKPSAQGFHLDDSKKEEVKQCLERGSEYGLAETINMLVDEITKETLKRETNIIENVLFIDHVIDDMISSKEYNNEVITKDLEKPKKISIFDYLVDHLPIMFLPLFSHE